jgi:hypothetical protein
MKDIFQRKLGVRLFGKRRTNVCDYQAISIAYCSYMVVLHHCLHTTFDPHHDLFWHPYCQLIKQEDVGLGKQNPFYGSKFDK